jgi:hypothetical protein
MFLVTVDQSRGRTAPDRAGSHSYPFRERGAVNIVPFSATGTLPPISIKSSRSESS